MIGIRLSYDTIEVIAFCHVSGCLHNFVGAKKRRINSLSIIWLQFLNRMNFQILAISCTKSRKKLQIQLH